MDNVRKLGQAQSLTKRLWYGDFNKWLIPGQIQKNSYILLRLPYLHVSTLDLFALAACRLQTGGVFDLTIPENQAEQKSSITSFVARAKLFGFDMISQSHTLSGLEFTFKYCENILPEGYEFMSAVHFEPECISLFSAVFNHEISPEFWQWKYRSNIGSYSLAAFYNGSVVAHYGVSVHKLRLAKSVQLSAQVGDVMIHPNHRGGLKSGLYQYLFKFVFTQLNDSVYSSHEANCYPVIGFGFPHGRHMKLGRRVSGYDLGAELLSVEFFPPREGHVAQTSQAQVEHNNIQEMNIEIIENSEFKRSYLNAWKTMCDSFSDSCLIDRSWSYFIRRYLRHPQHIYITYTVNSSVIVLRKTNDRHYILMDYIGCIYDVESDLKALLTMLRISAPRTRLTGWILDVHIDKLGIDFITILDRSAALALFYGTHFEELKNKTWWVTMGDSDFL